MSSQRQKSIQSDFYEKINDVLATAAVATIEATTKGKAKGNFILNDESHNYFISGGWGKDFDPEAGGQVKFSLTVSNTEKGAHHFILSRIYAGFHMLEYGFGARTVVDPTNGVAMTQNPDGSQQLISLVRQSPWGVPSYRSDMITFPKGKFPNFVKLYDVLAGAKISYNRLNESQPFTATHTCHHCHKKKY